MGGRGMSAGSSNIDGVLNHTFTLPEAVIAPGKITKKAEEVFTREYTSLRALATDLINDKNYDAAGYSTLHSNDSEPAFTKPVLKGIQSKINSEWKNIDIDQKLDVSTPEKRQVRRYALSMMQKMTNKYYRSMYGND